MTFAKSKAFPHFERSNKSADLYFIPYLLQFSEWFVTGFEQLTKMLSTCTLCRKSETLCSDYVISFFDRAVPLATGFSSCVVEQNLLIQHESNEQK